MGCDEVRRLLDQGFQPNRQTTTNVGIGFHIARCPKCYDYYNTHFATKKNLEETLPTYQRPTASNVSREEPTPLAATLTLEEPASREEIRLPSMWGHILWYLGMGTLGGLLLLVLLVILPPIISVFNIYDNVQAMYVPPATATSTTIPPQIASTQIILPTAAPSPLSLEPTVQPSQKPTMLPTPLPSNTPTPQPVIQMGQSNEPVTILLLGSDRRPGEPEPSRTDAVIVAHIDPQRQRVALLSIPRDLWADIPGYGYTRINAANVLGTTYNAPGGSRELVQTTVSQLLGIPIDHYVYIDFEGFTGAIDAIGGITVSVPKELYDPQFPAMDYSYMTAHFLPGPQRMDGTQALIYSRIRHTDNDFARMRRQQQVLVAILAELRGQHTLDTLEQTEAISTALRSYVETNLPPDKLIELAWSMRNTSPESVELYVLDETMITFGVGGDRWAIVARPGMLESLVDRLQEPQH